MLEMHPAPLQRGNGHPMGIGPQCIEWDGGCGPQAHPSPEILLFSGMGNNEETLYYLKSCPTPKPNGRSCRRCNEGSVSSAAPILPPGVARRTSKALNTQKRTLEHRPQPSIPVKPPFFFFPSPTDHEGPQIRVLTSLGSPPPAYSSQKWQVLSEEL